MADPTGKYLDTMTKAGYDKIRDAEVIRVREEIATAETENDRQKRLYREMLEHDRASQG